jgi:SAM-dependent methyltransferase
VLEQNFLHLELPAQRYDGVFANAVLFHVPSQVLPQVLRQLQACLRPGGVLFSSNPRGNGQEGWNGERYGAFHDWPTWRALVTAAGFDELDHFYRPAGLPGATALAGERVAQALSDNMQVGARSMLRALMTMPWRSSTACGGVPSP